MIEQFCIKSRTSCGVEDWRCFLYKDWENLELSERIDLIRQQRVKFYDDEGVEIPATSAVKLLF